MLTAVLKTDNTVTYRWMVGDKPIFEGEKVIGEPLKDARGAYEESVWVDFDKDKLVVNDERKSIILAARLLKENEAIKKDQDTSVVTLHLKELLTELDSSKITDELMAKVIRQIITLLLKEPPAPDILVKSLESDNASS